MNEKWKQLVACSGEYKEHNDCSVKALAIACEVPYEVAHETLRKLGRKNKNGVYMSVCHMAAKELGFELVEEKFPGKTVVTLERDLKRYGGARRYFIHVTRHFLAFDGTQVVDWSKGTRKRVHHCYRVKPINTAERGTVTGRFEVDKPSTEEVTRSLNPIDITAPWLRDMPRPKGAPKIGERVTQTIANNEQFTGEVTGYLAAQFIIKTGSGERVVHPGDEWERI
jgi:hypothetical protein